MANPLQGWNIIPRGELNSMVQSYYSLEMQFRERKRKACYEFYDRTDKIKDNRTKVKILKEVAEKYGFREECFMEWVRF